AELVTHSPARNHVACQSSGLFNIILGAGGSCTVDHLLCRAPAQHTDDASAQIGLRVVVAVRWRALVGDAQGLPTRHDGDAMYGIGARHHQAEDGVAAFVIRDTFPIRVAENEWSLRP